MREVEKMGKRTMTILYMIGVFLIVTAVLITGIVGTVLILIGIHESMNQEDKASAEVTQELSNICYTTNSEICD